VGKPNDSCVCDTSQLNKLLVSYASCGALLNFLLLFLIACFVEMRFALSASANPNGLVRQQRAGRLKLGQNICSIKIATPTEATDLPVRYILVVCAVIIQSFDLRFCFQTSIYELW